MNKNKKLTNYLPSVENSELLKMDYLESYEHDYNLEVLTLEEIYSKEIEQYEINRGLYE